MNKFNQLLSIGLSIGALSMASCSENDDPSGFEAPSDNAIRFAANTEFSRSGDITTNNLTSFNLYAYTCTMA